MAIDLSRWNSTIRNIANRLHSGKLKPEDLDTQLIGKIHDELTPAIEDGLGRTIYASRPGFVKTIHSNIFEFSAAKSYTELALMSNKLLDENGKSRTFTDFKKEVDKLHVEYNRDHLRTEHQTALAQARAADKWQRIQDRKELFPNLEYLTAGDDRVRDAHRPLHGVIRPVDDSFWSSNYPPNGWRCRCRVAQTNKGVTTGETPSLSVKDQPKQFRFNAGKAGVIFSKKHPYFTNLPQDNSTLSKALNSAKRRSPSYVGYTDNGRSVLVSPFGRDKDFKANYKSATRVVSELEKDVRILPNVNDGLKNPEYRIDGVVGDRVKPTGKNVGKAVDSAFSKKYRKGGQLHDLDSSFILLDFGALTEAQKKELARRLNGQMSNRGRNTFTIVQWKEGTVLINNDDNRSYDSILEALKVK